MQVDLFCKVYLTPPNIKNGAWYLLGFLWFFQVFNNGIDTHQGEDIGFKLIFARKGKLQHISFGSPPYHSIL